MILAEVLFCICSMPDSEAVGNHCYVEPGQLMEAGSDLHRRLSNREVLFWRGANFAGKSGPRPSFGRDLCKNWLYTLICRQFRAS